MPATFDIADTRPDGYVVRPPNSNVTVVRFSATVYAKLNMFVRAEELNGCRKAQD